MKTEDKAAQVSVPSSTTAAGGNLGEVDTPSNNASPGPGFYPGRLQILKREPLLWTLVVVLIALTAFSPARVSRYPQLVDWPTIAALAGLMILTKGIELSGYLHVTAARLIARLRTQRSLALFLVASAALLATVLTNDIALFIVVPLTLALRRLADLPVARLVIFEALAVNAGSPLTPIGNPQNLFLWRVSRVSFFDFTMEMLPLVALAMAALLSLTVFTFRSQHVRVDRIVEPPRLDKRLFLISIALYVPFVALIDMHQPLIGLTAVLAIYLLAFRGVVAKCDWALIAVFVLMFVDLRLIAESATIRELLHHVDVSDPRHLFLTGIVASQLISNVPAVILLEPFSNNWKLLAYAVNVGGFGFVLGSLANLIALRLAGSRGIWLTFHLYSVLFLLIVGLLSYAGWFWLRIPMLF